MEPMNAPLLQLRNATVVRDGRTILHVDDLAISSGEHVAVLGPNGSGKSTLIGLMTRDVRPLARAEGPSVLLAGRERWDLMEARRLLGVVSNALQEDYADDVSVEDVVLSGFFGSVGLYRTTPVTTSMRDLTTVLLAELGIAELSKRAFGTLSTGEARRALIARALVSDPATLVLDEPCDGLDPRAMWSFLRTLRRLATPERGLVLVTHHVDDIIPEVDRVIMLRDGRVIADDDKAELMTSERLSELFGFPARVEKRNGVYRLW
jgi:iron complex transport system ATP-binding protein